MEPAEELASSLSGEHIAKMLRTDGPIISCVILKCQSDDTTNAMHTKKLAVDSDSPPNPKGDCDDCGECDFKPSSSAAEAADGEKCEVLTDLISEIQIDTTPKKQMVAQTLGGPFTFLGQYEDEGIMVMIRRPEDIENDDEESGVNVPLNPHSLQPPLHNVEVYGDILLLRVAAVEEEGNTDDSDNGTSESAAEAKSPKVSTSEESKDSEAGPVVGKVMSNEEFFLNYTKEEYIKFASRTDIVAPEPNEEDAESEVDEDLSEDDEEEGDEDGDYNVESDDEDEMEDEECQIGMMNLILAQILKRFREENGRGPNTEELLAMRSALAEKLGIDESLINETTGGNSTSSEDQLADSEKRKLEGCKDDARQNQKRVKFNNEDEIKIMTDDEGSTNGLKDEGESVVPVA